MRTLPLTAVAVLAMSSVAIAKTPDGETPSVETVCDVYDGAAFGLCNAYCEAMDCDHPEVRAAEGACEVIARNFSKKTGEAVLPCDDVIEACTVVANDNVVYLTELGDWEDDVLSDDDYSPVDATIEVTDHTAPADITVDSDGLVTGTWTADEATYYRFFHYTACCDAGTCDTASVLVYSAGS